jgi:hypothetical protein
LLRSALESETRLTYGGDDHTGGADLRAGPWTPPDRVAPDLADEARRLMGEFEAFGVPAHEQTVIDWLMALFRGMAHAMDEEALMSRAVALAEAIEDFPRFCFTKSTRKRALRRFGFIPTAKELAELFDEVEAEEREIARRLMGLIDAAARKPARKAPDGESPRQASQWGWSSEAERLDHEAYLRDKRDRERRELAAIARQQAAADGLELPPTLEPAPLETAKDFAARVRAQTDQFLDAETKAMKRGGRGTGGRLKQSSPAQIAEALKVLKGTPPVPRPDIAERARVQEEEPEPAPEVAP